MTFADSTPDPACPPAAGPFYDARRDVYYTKPALRGWLHLLWFAASLVFGIHPADPGARRRPDHRRRHLRRQRERPVRGQRFVPPRQLDPTAWRQRLQRLDHLMIFFLIAGTATPAFLIAMPGPLGLTGLIAGGRWPLPRPRCTWRG